MELRLTSSVDDPARKALSRANSILFVSAAGTDLRLQQLMDFFARFGYSVSRLALGPRFEPRGLETSPAEADVVAVWPDAEGAMPFTCWTFFARARRAHALWFEPSVSGVPVVTAEAAENPSSYGEKPAASVSAYNDGELLVFTGRGLHRAYVELFITCSCT